MSPVHPPTRDASHFIPISMPGGGFTCTPGCDGVEKMDPLDKGRGELRMSSNEMDSWLYRGAKQKSDRRIRRREYINRGWFSFHTLY